MTRMVTDWNAELALLQDPLYRERRTVYLNTLSLAQRHAWIFHLYWLKHENDDVMVWILHTIATLYNEMDERYIYTREAIHEQLIDNLTTQSNNPELLTECLAIMTLLR